MTSEAGALERTRQHHSTTYFQFIGSLPVSCGSRLDLLLHRIEVEAR
jgi:hypothetical protein